MFVKLDVLLDRTIVYCICLWQLAENSFRLSECHTHENQRFYNFTAVQTRQYNVLI